MSQESQVLRASSSSAFYVTVQFVWKFRFRTDADRHEIPRKTAATQGPYEGSFLSD